MLYEKLVTHAGDLWSQYVNHEFATLLAKNTMRKEKFAHYLQQDYLYLIAYTNCFKHLQEFANTEEEKEFFKRNTVNDLEKDLALKFDVDVENIKTSKETLEYVNYLYECLATKSALEKLICLAPCAIGYGVMGNYISSLKISQDNDYTEWIKTYESDAYNSVVEEYIELINKYEVSNEEFEELSKIFNRVCELEIAFFNQVLTTSKPTVLTIAGSDSSGGAGIQADIKTISANGGYAASVITAITAQNTTGVKDICELEDDIIISQIEAVTTDLDVSTIKIGMLGNSRIINAVSTKLDNSHKIILDPVMVAKDKSVLLNSEAITTLIKELFPKALLITPNIEEANQILNCNITTEKDMEESCIKLQKLGAKNVLLKGGHLKGNSLVDVLYFNQKFYKFYQERIDTIHTHGTGCSLSSAIATNVAKNQELNVAVENAIKFVYDGILFNYEVGMGKSPINHFHSKGAHYE